MWRVVKRVAGDIAEDRVPTYAAALAFYTTLSLPPLIVLLVWFLGRLGAGSEEFLRNEIGNLVGSEGTKLVDSILEASDTRISLGGVSGWIGLAALLFAASGVFSQLQMAMNRVWEVQAKPGGGVTSWLRKRFLSLGVVGVIAFLATVSLAASTLLSAIGLGGASGVLVNAVHILVSVAIFTGLFAVVLKFLPDVRITWRDSLVGAAVTSVLFHVSKYLIALYLAKKGVGEEYGSAGSAVVVIVWVYFNAIVVLIGSEVTQALLHENGRRLEPNEFAVRITKSKPAEAG